MNQRNTAVVYSSGVCNLNCRYCSIDKNPVLIDIDKSLAKSFEGDYYFEQIKKYFPNRGQLKRLETWGGEPFLYMERVYPLLHNLINHYPYFEEMFSSTNFAFPGWDDKVFELLNQFALYPHRDFYFFLQLSCDGPHYINDAGRGEGTTDKCLANFQKFINKIGTSVPENVVLDIALKPTLDINNLRLIDTKEKIIAYYQFFEENFIYPIAKLNYSNINIHYPIPNMAVPVPATQEDGIFFAEYCKNCREIEEENVTNKYFIYYDNITMFGNENDYNNLSYKYPCHTCGTGVEMIGFLPDNMISVCHEGFTNFAEKYKEMAASSNRIGKGTIYFDEFIKEQPLRYCMNEETFKEFEIQMKYYLEPETTSRLATAVSEIMVLAMAGQVEKQYIEPENALKAAIFLQGRSSYCIKNNFNSTGSVTLRDYGLLKLFFNGAAQHIQSKGAKLRINDC